MDGRVYVWFSEKLPSDVKKLQLSYISRFLNVSVADSNETLQWQIDQVRDYGLDLSIQTPLRKDGTLLLDFLREELKEGGRLFYPVDFRVTHKIPT